MMPIGHLLRDKKGVISRSAELQDLLSIPGRCQIIRTGFLLSSCLWVPSLCQNFHLRTRLLCSLKNSSSLMNRVYCIHIPGLEPTETWIPENRILESLETESLGLEEVIGSPGIWFLIRTQVISMIRLIWKAVRNSSIYPFISSSLKWG